MKTSYVMLALVLLLAGATASDSAFADRGRSGRSSQFSNSAGFARQGHTAQPKRHGQFAHPKRHGRFLHRPHSTIFIGVPLLAPLYAPVPYYPPRPAAPTVYIEQASEPQDQAHEQSYWYYCAEAKAYYPYVSDCPGGWQQVVPSSSPP